MSCALCLINKVFPSSFLACGLPAPAFISFAWQDKMQQLGEYTLQLESMRKCKQLIWCSLTPGYQQLSQAISITLNKKATQLKNSLTVLNSLFQRGFKKVKE